MYETIETVRLEEYDPSSDGLISLDDLDDMDVMEEILDSL